MASEPVKTGIMLGLALISSIVAFFLMPKTIELKDQERVNELLFPSFETAEVRTVQIQGLMDPTINLSAGSRGPTQLTMRLTNKGWFIQEYDNFPAGNNKLIGEITATMSGLKIVEVVSENPSETELVEYGLVAPDGENMKPDEVGVRLALMDVSNTTLAEIIVGKQAKTASDKATYYVRSTAEDGIFRVQIDKGKLEPYLLSWVDSNPMEIRAPENIPVVNAGFRTMDSIMVATAADDPNAYRAHFKFGSAPLKKLEIREGDKWVETDRRRLQADAQASQNWLMGLEAIPSIVYMANVEKKSNAVQQAMEIGVLTKNTKLGELITLGYQLETAGEDTFLVGQSGRAVIDTTNGIRFHMVFGKPTDDDLLPLVLYAEASPNANLQPPAKEELPEEAKDWDDKKRKTELDLIERRYQEALSKYRSFGEQLQQELENTNKRTAPWIYYVPADMINQFIPSIRLKAEETPVEAAPTTPAVTDTAEEAPESDSQDGSPTDDSDDQADDNQ